MLLLHVKTAGRVMTEYDTKPWWCCGFTYGLSLILSEALCPAAGRTDIRWDDDDEKPLSVSLMMAANIPFSNFKAIIQLVYVRGSITMSVVRPAIKPTYMDDGLMLTLKVYGLRTTVLVLMFQEVWSKLLFWSSYLVAFG